MDDQGASFPNTRQEALARWREFLPLAPSYGSARNHVRPGHPHVSRVSPAVRVRLVTEDELAQEALAQHRFAAIEKLLQELDWRRYWKGWLEARPDVWRAYRARLARDTGTLSESERERVLALCEGRSGVGIMDAFARELVTTGYMHNHARMWFASFWIHVERLPWTLGAQFFYRHLLDADPASNTLSWRWVAGLQTRGKTYLVKRTNIEKYCDPALLADRRGLHRLDDARVHAVRIEDDADLSPEPLVPLPACPEHLPEPYGLWIHGDDLAPEHSELASLRPASVAAALSHRLVESFALSEGRFRHLKSALEDGLARATAHYGCEARLVADDLAPALATWAQRERLHAVVAHAPFVGPLGDCVPAIRAALADVGAKLVLVRRTSDDELLPLARAGFFGFWAKSAARFRRVAPAE